MDHVPLAYGTMQWGGTADRTAARAMFDVCLAAGLTHFDTACGYTDGASETILGEFAAAVGRDRLTIATKLGYEGGGGRTNLEAQFEGSLRRLKMERVDLLYLHRWDGATPLEETFGLFAEWQAQGKVGALGVSNYAAWQVMKAQGVCAALGTRIAAIQPMYNLVKRQAEVELLPMAADQGIAVYSYSPLGGGLLSGKYAAGGTGRLTTDPRYAERYRDPARHAAAAGLARLAAEAGVAPATLAVAWVMAHPARPVPLISARSLDQLRPSLAAADYELAPDLKARLDALYPAPPPATDRSEEG